ncbi:MAG TPA: 3-hydroxyacyl-ACP dehydratase FabZ [Steroidobacteraceae bacterium]|nr:3-hydroxyacyl-ACP dehydratase FabZ [Steroidobacteraceae bacterium]
MSESEPDKSEPVKLDISGVMQRLPHRYPFLLVDRVLECVRGQSIRALKNVSFNEPYFGGHFPGRPVMPGVLIIEALAQVAGLLAYISADVIANPNASVYFVGIDKARFRRPVVPGDQLILTARFERSLRGIWQLATAALVDGEEVAHAQIMVAPNLKEATAAPGTELP